MRAGSVQAARRPGTQAGALALGLVAVLALAGCASAPEAPPPEDPMPPTACETLPGTFAAPGVRLTAAQSVPAGLTVSGMAQPYPMPAHCLVRGVINERTGIDGKPYAIGFEMRLPANWNRRYVVQANGGNDGVVQPAFGNVVASGATSNALMKGFAVVSSDAGHAMERSPQAGLTGGSLFGFDPQARLDYGYQAMGTLAPVGRKLALTHYGLPVKRSYMMGCSNGGRHGMVAASRWADQFDGILAGNPGFNLPRAALQHAWDIQALATVAPEPRRAFSPDDMKRVARAVLERCDALDGAADGMVDDLPACQRAFRIESLQCQPGQTNGQCLSAAQVGALAKMFGGVRNSQGEPLYSDWPWDAGIGASQIGFGSWRAWKLEGPIANLPIIGVLGASSLAQIFSTPPRQIEGTPPALMRFLLDFNIDAGARAISATDGVFRESSLAFMTPPQASDLSAYKRNGGKLIVYHGASDPVFSVNDTIRWWQELDRTHGGRGAEFARLFTIPGLNHCQGGPATEQFDLLDALVDWVERGQPPQRVIATARVGVNPDVPADWRTADGRPRSRPLCPWPQQARYRGQGDLNDAASFACVTPR